MDWFFNLFTSTASIPHIVILYAMVIACGVYLGKVKIYGISLGVTFVLFAGILAGHIGFTAPIEILSFIRDFGLILFVFMIGLQVGPGFFETFRKGGITLNILSVSTIILNVIVMFICYYIFFDSTSKSDLAMLVGTLNGAVTNTPGLGAATEALNTVWQSKPIPSIASGYACAYPLGVLGIIGSTIAIRFIAKISLKKEEEDLNEPDIDDLQHRPHKMHLKITNAYLQGKTINEIRELTKRHFVCSRILHNGDVKIPNKNTMFSVGDEILIVCAEVDTTIIKDLIGDEIPQEWIEEQKEENIVSQRIIVTNSAMSGKSLLKLHLRTLYGVNVTRITRQGIDIFATPSYQMQIGDRIRVVGPQENINKVADMMGNSSKRLNTPNIATIFIGILLGIILGSIPFYIPNMPVPLKLGIAAGPLITAILIGRFGYRMRLITYTTTSASLMLREIGLALFLASVGIMAGDGFIETIIHGDGLRFVLVGFLITIIPILIMGTIARKKYKLNYFILMGMIAGTYTDPPALAYSSSICTKDAPAIGYSTVYPLSMFIRILTAQIIIMLFCA